MTQAEQASQGQDDEEENKRNKLENLTREAKDQADMKKELEQELKLTKEPLKALKREKQFIDKEKATASSSLRKAVQRLKEKRDEIVARAGSAESEEARRALKLKELAERIEAANKKKAELKQAVTDSRRAYDELEPHVTQAKQNCDGAKNRLHAIESRIGSLQSSSSNSVAIFGSKCPKVKQSVRRDFSLNRTHG